ncbi:MAG: hypothetical protein OEW68_03470 [Gammaproteobacteria bacterium]|nr:hypothetical protein [Gammaproteobacteria bacterium]MDH4313880.1 hypothetical protein [Gammaproteobacteria bacterium]MDH5501883.1 hypothetical protein [Gammaproteobacteria bacterium]
MDTDFLIRNWGLLAASVLLLAVVLNVIFQRLWQSPFGQLRRALTDLQERSLAAAKSGKFAEKAESRLDRMLQESAKIRPSELQEAKGVLQDARALQKIANDKLMIAENHVRRIIHEEFPPYKQDRLRERYLRQSAADRRPFSF